MSTIAEAQRRGLRCLFCDAEHSADPLLFEAMGVNINELDAVKAYSGDENLEVIETLIKTGDYAVAVVDSVSALIPRQEAESAIGDQHIGLLARLMSQSCRKFAQMCSETNTLLIFINQVRNKIGWGDPETTTGGQALDFYATGRIKVSGGEYKNSHIKDAGGEVIGHKTDFYIKKNKLAPPFRKAQIPLIYGKGYDSHWEILSLALGLGIVDKHGAWYKYNDENLAQGEENTTQWLREHNDVYNEIKDRIIESTGLKELYEKQASRRSA
jgi:recombination protein RecA